MDSTKNDNTISVMERRQGRRVSLLFDVEVKTWDGRAAMVQGTEIGLGGLRFRAPFPLVPLSRLKARFVLQASQEEVAFEVSASVLRCRALFSPTNRPLYEVAIKFDAFPVDEGYRLQRLLENLASDVG